MNKGIRKEFSLRMVPALLMAAIASGGCVSLQGTDGSGKPWLIGWGKAAAVAGTGARIFRVVAPGISVRIASGLPGLSLGWHETLFFYPSTAGQIRAPGPAVAVQSKCLGVDLTPMKVMLGYERIFAIPLPPAGKGVCQFISYSANNPTQTVVERKEIP